MFAKPNLNGGDIKLKRRLKDTLAYLAFFYYYIGPISFLSYFMGGRALPERFGYWGWGWAISFSIFGLSLLGVNGFVDGIYVIRFYWGFLLFYLAFKSGIQLQVDKLLIFLSVLTIIEAVLVNTVISAEGLPNYPVTGAYGHFADPGGYQRPYSFGASATVTSVVLTALLAMTDLGWRSKLLAFTAISACMSGTGFVVLFVYLLARTAKILYFLLMPAIVCLVYKGSELGLDKISIEYFSFLYDFKMDQIRDQISSQSIFIGVPLKEGVDGPGGDFAFLTFIQFNGLVGVLLFLIFIVVNTNKKNWLSLLIILLGAFHYGTIFYLPGQLILGYLLNLNSEPPSMSAVDNQIRHEPISRVS